MSFVKQCGIFCTFIFFSFVNLMKQWNNNELKVILGGHGPKLMAELSKDGGRFMRSTMYVFIFNLHFNGT